MSWAQTTYLETVRVMRIITYIWARILPRTQAIWLALDNPSSEPHFPSNAPLLTCSESPEAP